MGMFQASGGKCWGCHCPILFAADAKARADRFMAPELAPNPSSPLIPGLRDVNFYANLTCCCVTMSARQAV